MPDTFNIRIGQGFDVHAFGDGDHVMVGGVRIPFERGVLAPAMRDLREAGIEITRTWPEKRVVSLTIAFPQDEIKVPAK